MTNQLIHISRQTPMVYHAVIGKISDGNKETCFIYGAEMEEAVSIARIHANGRGICVSSDQGVVTFLPYTRK